MRKVLAGIVLVLIVILASYGWYRRALSPLHPHDHAGITVRVAPGSSVRAIGVMLEEKGIIRSAFAFRLYARSHDAESIVQAGSFFLRPSLSVSEIMSALRGGFAAEAIVTIPEGYTLDEIETLLVEKELLKSGELVTCARDCDFSAFTFLPAKRAELALRGATLEGYLFPDTYFIVRDGFQLRAFVSRLLQNFQKRIVEDLEKDIAASGHSLQEIIAMASLVEEETKTDEERPIVAGILWKRLEANELLGVDAAVRYIVKKPTEAITNADLDVNSPYNLRKVKGLPPGPITNPGLASIKAALHPQESDYWFYLHGKDGNIRYAKTNEEHNENKRKYLQ